MSRLQKFFLALVITLGALLAVAGWRAFVWILGVG